MNYSAIKYRNRRCELSDDKGNLIGVLSTEKWTSRKSDIHLESGAKYELLPKNWLMLGSFTIEQDAAYVGSATGNSRGQIVISLESGIKITISLTKSGLKGSYLSLIDEQFEEVARIRVKYVTSFKKKVADYSFETFDECVEGANEYLLLVVVFCLDFFRTGAVGV